MVAPQSAGAVHVILPMALGFGLAPYFDLTFHRAFARTNAPRLCFTLGFAFAFGVLLVGIYWFAGTLGMVLERPAAMPPSLQLMLAMLVLQLSFTAAAHLNEIAAAGAGSRRM